MNDLFKLIPYISNSSTPVKVIFSIWAIVSVVLVIAVIFDKNRTHQEKTVTKEPQTVSNEETPTAMPSSGEETSAEKAPEQLPQDYSPTSAEIILSTLKDKDLTDLQRNNFMKRHEGRIVRWEGIMLDIKSYQSDDAESIMVFRLPSDESSIPEMITATFSSDASDDLSDIRKGQKVVIQGNLEFVDSYRPSPSIRNARLISVAN